MIVTPTQKAKLAQLLKRTQTDPALFNSAVLGRSPFWAKQLEMCRLVQNHKVTVIVSGNATGKSFWLSSLILWYLYSHRGSKVVTTAPSHVSLSTILWENIRTAFYNARIPLGGKIS